MSDMPIERKENDIMMKISGKEDILKRKTYTLIKVNDETLEKVKYSGLCQNYFELKKKGWKIGDKNDKERTLLLISENEKVSLRLRRKLKIEHMEEISKENDNFNLIEDYDLWYAGPSMFGIEIEEVFSDYFNDDVLELRRRDCFFFFFWKFEIKVFLREIGPQGIDENEWIRPIDIRNLDVNRSILDILKKKSTEYMCEDPENFVAEFECVSERLQSQHFLTLIHSNTAWEAYPVNIFQFIISAYVLPGFVNKDSLVKMPREKLVRDNAKGKRYLLDSIHFHSDIYFDVKELQHNMGKLFLELLFD